MSSSFEQSLRCLKIYLERGRSVLENLRLGVIDRIDDDLKWRKAAFINFKFYDELARQTDDRKLDERQRSDNEAKLQALWLEVDKVDRELTALLNQEARSLAQQVVSIRATRSKLRCFHSGTKIASSLNRPV
jgi:hypothetical protein